MGRGWVIDWLLVLGIVTGIALAVAVRGFSKWE